MWPMVLLRYIFSGLPALLSPLSEDLVFSITTVSSNIKITLLKHLHELPQNPFSIRFSLTNPMEEDPASLQGTPSFCSREKKRVAERSPFNLQLAESSFPLALFQLGRGTCCQNPVNHPVPRKQSLQSVSVLIRTLVWLYSLFIYSL